MRGIPILIVEECKIKMKVWTKLDTSLPIEKFYEGIGKFVSDAMQAIVQECNERNIDHCIHLIPQTVSKKRYEELDHATALGELTRMVKDVEDRSNDQ